MAEKTADKAAGVVVVPAPGLKPAAYETNVRLFERQLQAVIVIGKQKRPSAENLWSGASCWTSENSSPPPQPGLTPSISRNFAESPVKPIHRTMDVAEKFNCGKVFVTPQLAP